jgi:general stress protein 26
VWLIGRAADHEFDVRPMVWARMDEDGTSYFVVRVGATHFAEVERYPEVAVPVQRGTEHAAIRGIALATRARGLLDQCGRESWRVWFPRGFDEPNVAVLVVRPLDVKFWSLRRGEQGAAILRLGPRGPAHRSQAGDHPTRDFVCAWADLRGGAHEHHDGNERR